MMVERTIRIRLQRKGETVKISTLIPTSGTTSAAKWPGGQTYTADIDTILLQHYQPGDRYIIDIGEEANTK